jgi:HPt (histidine-containing phosphotransfer) domain-containing protein
MDIQMPEMDGLMTTKKIREREKGTRLHMPIIAMTAHAMKGDRERCIEAGMDGYVSKPISSLELKEAIAAAFNQRGSSEFVSSLNADQEEAPPPTAIAWDMGKTLERLGGDKELCREVIEIFLNDVPKHMASLRRAIEDGDAEAIERTAHTLKGELGYLGILEISKIAHDMETFGQRSDLRLAANLYATLEPEISEVLASMRKAVGLHPDVEMVTGWPGANQ